MNPEPLKEIPAPKVEIPPCDIRYVTVGLWRGSRAARDQYWMADYHITLKAAEADAESYVPGTMRIFEVPDMGGK